MTRHLLRWALPAALAVTLAAPAAQAQSDGLVQRGLRAYQDVQFATAARMLRLALADTLGDGARTQALAYLGAAEVFAGPARRDSARSAFRRLVLLDPRHRPDPLVFPPQVLAVYDEVRRSTKAVRVEAAPEASFRPGGDGGGFIARLYGTSYHEVEVRIAKEDGAVVRTLYVGPVSDSLEVRWDGLDTDGADVRTGRYVLAVASRPSPGRPVVRMVQVPLRADLVALDTLALLPSLPDSLLRPERASLGAGIASLAAGLLVSGAALALPPLIADGTEPSGARFAVAGAVTLAGIVGLVTQPGRVRRRNVAANEATRAAWQRRVDELRVENARRRDAARLTVRVGTPRVIESVGEGR
ncbi:MAG TPA: FlgD immunoglobulin-like domain containing protein [Gemmatimonadales bacterium]